MSTILPRETRLQLVHFLCVFAWIDLRVGRRERRYILDLCRLLELDAEERIRVEGWLERPPEEDALSDPQSVPSSYRELFLDEVSRLIASDETLDVEEVDAMRTLRALLFPNPAAQPSADDGGAGSGDPQP